jgi:hypothetical protein
MRVGSVLRLAAALVLLPALPAAAASGERITSYDTQLTVRPDGSMQVLETIGYDFGRGTRGGGRRSRVTRPG